MEFRGSFPLPAEVAAQFGRVTQGIGQEYGEAITLYADTLEDFPDVETFLTENAGLYEGINELWRDVDGTKAELHEAQETLVILDREETDEAGVIHQYFRAMTEQDGRAARREAQSMQVDVAEVVADTNRVAHNIVESLMRKGVNHYLQEQVTKEKLHSIAADVRAHTASLRVSHQKKVTGPIVRHDPIDRKFKAAKFKLLDNYTAALFAQALGSRRIQELMSNPKHALPFAERLQELSLLGKYGSFEFPGLLETAAAYVATKNIEGKPNIIQFSLGLAKSTINPREKFITDLITDSEVKNKLVSPNSELMAGILSVQQVARIMTRDGRGMTLEQFIEYISEDFTSMPGWEGAYDLQTNNKVKSIWTGVWNALLPYRRQGRLITNYRPKPTSGDIKAVSPRKVQQRGKKKKATGPTPKTDAIRNVEDLTADHEEEPPITSFGVLKGTGGKSKDVFTFEPTENLDSLMRTPVIKKFLTSHGALTADLRKYLQHIADVPRTPATEILNQRGHFRVVDDSVVDVRYSLRRFSPRKATIEGGSSHEHSSRIRIVFGVIIVDGKRCIAIEDVGLRETNTY